MSIQIGTHARIGAKSSVPFENIREVIAIGDPDYMENSSLRERLRSAHLQCQKGTTLRSAARCLPCPRLVNILPKEDAVVVRCLWTDTDLVESLMTIQSALVGIHPSASLLEACGLAAEHNIQHLLVVEEGRLVGLLSPNDMKAENLVVQKVSDLANLCPWVVGPKTTLAEAAQIMTDKQVSILPIVENREVLGVVTVGDLRRAGAKDTAVGQPLELSPSDSRRPCHASTTPDPSISQSTTRNAIPAMRSSVALPVHCGCAHSS